MKRPFLIICASLFVSIGWISASPLDDLASPDQQTRDKAAIELRASYQEISQSKWQTVFESIKVGQTKESVMRLLEPFHVKPEMGAGSGGSYSESYRLDDGWMLICWYVNKDDSLIEHKLIKATNSVWVEPPKNFTGKWITYFVNGQKSHEINYQNGQYFGEFISHHDNGVRSVVQHYDETGANGEDTGYHPSGNIAYKGRYERGKQVGKWIWYDDEGNVTNTREESGVYQYNMTYSPDKFKGPHGILFCNGSSLRVAFEQVVTPLGEFIRVKDEGGGDWQQVESGRKVVVNENSVASDKAFLTGSFQQPPRGVGSDWFYVVKKAVWVDPKKSYEVDLENISTAR